MAHETVETLRRRQRTSDERVLAGLLAQAEELGRTTPPDFANDGRWAYIDGYEQCLTDLVRGLIVLEPA